MKVTATIPKKIKPGKHKCHIPFKKVGWPEDHPMVNANKKAKPGETTFNDKFYVLDGSEDAECTAEWLKDFDIKILQPMMRRKQKEFKKNPKAYENTDIFDSIQDCFMKLTDGTVQTAVKATLANIDPATSTMKVGDVSMFENEHCKKQLLAYTEQKKLKQFQEENLYYRVLMYREVLHRIKIAMYGNDSTALNSFMELKSTIRTLKANPTTGIRQYDERKQTLQSYLPYQMWQWGDKSGQEKKPYGEEESREHLHDALTREQKEVLLKNKWEIFENPYADTISQLAALEPALVEQLQVKARLKKLEDEKEAKRTNGGKRNSDGSPKNNKGKATPGEKKECKHCGKKHAGKCWSLDKNNNSNSKNQKFHKNTGFSKAQFATMKKLMSSTKSSQRSTIDTDSSSDEEDSNQYSWAKGVPQVQQMYISQAYKRDNGMDSDEEVREIPDDELKALKKKAKRASKSLGCRRK